MVPACRGCARPRFKLDLELVLPAVEAVVAKIGEITKPEGPGGAFALMELQTGKFLIGPVVVGNPTKEKKRKYLRYCREKATRLKAMHQQRGDMLSAQSRDPDKEKYGGSICDTIYIWSFSGLPEFGDETAMLLSAQRTGQMTWGTAASLAELSGNDILKREMFFDPFWEAETS